MSSEPEFAGFLSYVRADDDDGGITALCEALEREVRLQLGRPFQIFRDVEDIRWGQRWKRRIESTIDNASVLIPVITPAFFTRPECRREVERFLEREKQLGRDELIFAMHYVNTRAGDDPLVKELFARQMADWRPLRLEPLTAQPVRKRLAELASRIRDVFDATPSPPLSAVAAPSQSTASESRAPETSVIETPTIVVDPLGRLGPTTILAAIEAADPGMRIVVHPGLYTDPLVIEKPLEIIGLGTRDEIVIRVEEENALGFVTSFGRISNLTLHRAGPAKRLNAAVWVRQGRLELQGCDVRSDAGSCLYVTDGADPRVRDNKIHNAGQAGILIAGQALGTFEDNDVFSNALAALEVDGSSNPTVRRNRLRDSRGGGGIFVHDGSTGTYEGNELSGADFAGIEVGELGYPMVRGNRIIGNTGGVYVHTGGGGVFENNQIEDPKPWDVEDDCVDNVIARGNTPEWTKS